MRSVLLTIGAFATILPAFGGITYSCNTNIDILSGTTACETLQTTIAGLYASTFSNANASIFIQFGNNGGLGESQQSLGLFSYTSYRAALVGHEGDANDVTAVGTLPGTDPFSAGASVLLTTALANAIGIPDTFGITSAGANCSSPGTGNCYDGLITLNDPADLAILTGGQGYFYRSGVFPGNDYDFFSVVQHETDEILGTVSCLTTTSGAPANFCGAGNAAPVDLFRYSAPGTRSFLATANGTLAYFSINGGTTNLATYNNSPNNEDYGDFSTNCQHVQDAAGCLGAGFDIGAAEKGILDAVGFNLNSAVPEPSTFGLLGASLASLAWLRVRRNRR